MARKCEEDIVPETKTNFSAECKTSSNGTTTVKGAAAASVAAVLLPPKTTVGDQRVLVAPPQPPVSASPKLDDDADDILSMSLNKIDSPPPRPVSRTKVAVNSNSNSSSSNSSAGAGVDDLVRRKTNALSKVQSKSDSPLDGATGGKGPATPAAGTAAGAAEDMDSVDLCSTDEVKVFKDEGDRDDEKMSVEHNLLEEKSSLIDFTENEGKILKAQNPRYHVSAEDPHPARSKLQIEADKRGEATLSSVLASHHAAAAAANPFNMGYPFVSPYPTYSNGDPISMPMANKIGIPPSFFCYSTNSSEPSHSLSAAVATHHLTTPPPAHCGIPPYQLDAKGIAGLSSRGSLYAFAPPNPHQYHPSFMLGADLGNNWHAPSVYSSVVAAAASAGFRNSSYPPPPHDFSSFRFSHLIPPQSSAASAAAAASIASSVANHNAAAHHSYVTGQFPPQLPPSYSLAGLTTPSSPSLVNSGPKQSVSTSSSKSNKHRYFPSIPSSLGDQGSSQSPTGQQQSKNGGGSAGDHRSSKEAKMMAAATAAAGGSPYGRGDMKGSKHVLDNTSIGLQGLSKVEVGADLSSTGGANRLSSGLLYQPYDAISKELGGCHPGDKVGSNHSMGGSGGLLGSSGGPGSMMSDGDQSRDSSGQQQQPQANRRQPQKQKPHIKKPLNAFMLYMKDMRANVVAECTLKESAAINQILGRRWHSLSREEQSKYYEKARMERQLHMELYPGWSARDNYGYGSKKKKRKKDRGSPNDISSGNNMKKCRARYGLDQQNQWCKPCRRKKKCIKYMEMLMMSGGAGGGGSGGGAGSLSGTMSPDYGNEFDNHNDDDDDDDEDDGSGEDSDEHHMDDMDDDIPSNEMGGGGGAGGGGSGLGGQGNQQQSGGPNGGPSPFLMQGPPRNNDGDHPQQVAEQAEKIFGNPAAQACPVGVATIKQERDFGKGFDDQQQQQQAMHPGGSVAAYNAMLAGQMMLDHHQLNNNAHLLQHHHNSLLHSSHHMHHHSMLNGSNPSSPASMLMQQQGGGGSSGGGHHQPSATTTVGPHSQDDKHGMHMYPFQSKHQASVCFPPSPAASSSSSLTAPLSNNPKMNNSHSLWLASSPMLMTPATLSGSDQSPQRQTPEETKTKNGSGGLYGDHHGPSSVETAPHHQQMKKKKRRRKRKHSKGVAGARNGSGGMGGGAAGMSKSIQHILLRAIFEGNSGQVTNGDKENVIEFIEHFFRTRHSNHRMRQLIQARMNSSSGESSTNSSSRHHNKSSRHSDSDGGETDSSSCSDNEDEEIVGCPRSSSKPFTISSIIG